MIGRSGIFPLTSPGGKMDITGRKLLVQPGIGEIRNVVHRIVEIKIVVEHSVHKILQIVHAGQCEAAFDDGGMLDKRICGVIRAERSTHSGDADSRRLTVVPDKRYYLFAQVGIKHGLHIAAMKRVRTLIVKAEAIDGVDRIKLELPVVNKIGERANQGLAFELALVAGAGGETDQRRAPMAVDHDAKIQPEAVRIPAMDFTFHQCDLVATSRTNGGCESMPAGKVSGNCSPQKMLVTKQDKDDVTGEMAYNLSKAIASRVHPDFEIQTAKQICRSNSKCHLRPPPN